MKSSINKLAKHPFILGFCGSLVMIAVGYFSFCPGSLYIHRFLLKTSYSGFANAVSLFQFFFSFSVCVIGMICCVGFLVVGLISALSDYLRRKKTRAELTQ